MWSALAGLAGSLLIGFPMQAMLGALTTRVAPLVGSDSLLVGWMVHLAAGLLFGALYGALVWTRSLDRGFAQGFAYGLIVGVFGAWLGMRLVLGQGLALELTGLMLVVLHAMWGILLGLMAAWGLREVDEARAATRARRGMRV